MTRLQDLYRTADRLGLQVCCFPLHNSPAISSPDGCIGLDKEEIVARAREIGTFETSVLPYDDCCVMFTPKHPDTRPDINEILAEEAKLDVEGLVERALATDRRVHLG